MDGHSRDVWIHLGGRLDELFHVVFFPNVLLGIGVDEKLLLVSRNEPPAELRIERAGDDSLRLQRRQKAALESLELLKPTILVSSKTLLDLASIVPDQVAKRLNPVDQSVQRLDRLPAIIGAALGRKALKLVEAVQKAVQSREKRWRVAILGRRRQVQA